MELALQARSRTWCLWRGCDLITWLEGASDESEYIKALESDGTAAKSAQVASGAVGGVSTVPSGAAGARTGEADRPAAAADIQPGEEDGR